MGKHGKSAPGSNRGSAKFIGAPIAAIAVTAVVGSAGMTAMNMASGDFQLSSDDHTKVMAAAIDGKGYVSDADLVEGEKNGVGGGQPTVGAPQILTGEFAVSNAPITNYDEQLRKAVEFSNERAEADRLARMPSTVVPADGAYTSGFGMRWGTNHNGIDIANAIGTPIYSAMDGVVVDAGEAQGYGQWVRVLHGDGAITVYGHVETIDCYVGQKVMAGEKIAGMGNRGFSTGPHLHFEIWPDGANPVDPVPWLQEHGVNFG